MNVAVLQFSLLTGMGTLADSVNRRLRAFHMMISTTSDWMSPQLDTTIPHRLERISREDSIRLRNWMIQPMITSIVC